jgi:hypothetical protein
MDRASWIESAELGKARYFSGTGSLAELRRIKRLRDRVVEHRGRILDGVAGF